MRDTRSCCSIGERYSATDGRPSGFDFLRVFLSVAIIAVHSCLTSYGQVANDALYDGPLGRFCNLLVPMFFALSGFLVAGSLREVADARHVPWIACHPHLSSADGVEVVLSAFLLGPLVTALPLSVYFSDPLFFQYMLNAVGDVHLACPASLQKIHGPASSTDNSGTIPYELYCYCTLALVALLGLKRWRVLGRSSSSSFHSDICLDPARGRRHSGARNQWCQEAVPGRDLPGRGFDLPLSRAAAVERLARRRCPRGFARSAQPWPVCSVPSRRPSPMPRSVSA